MISQIGTTTNCEVYCIKSNLVFASLEVDGLCAVLHQSDLGNLQWKQMKIIITEMTKPGSWEHSCPSSILP